MKIQKEFSLQPPTAEIKAKQQDQQMREAAKLYERHFLNEMVKAMRKTVPRQDGLIKENFAEKIFTEQLDQQYVEGWSERGGIGLADMIYSQIRSRFGSEKPPSLNQPKGMLPVSPQKDEQGMKPTDSIQIKTLPATTGAKLNYRFEVQDPAGRFDVQAPMAGRVLESTSLGQGWNMVRLDHGQGLQSELTFPGHLAQNVSAAEIQPGQKLGVLDLQQPVLAWKLDWT